MWYLESVLLGSSSSLYAEYAMQPCKMSETKKFNVSGKSALQAAELDFALRGGGTLSNVPDDVCTR
jgi:hypothetical protein